ncbi:MAG TPA: UpxY family transcription antiterminator [Bryobacteraceae bacterium]|nr:UpxY family transcription antiterminator [Bryobacteraceae bacterium]
MSAIRLSPLEEPARGGREAWFAIRVRSNFEKSVATGLRDKGFEEFLPLYRTRRQWSDRIKEVELPLFPGYIFGRFDPSHLWPVLSVQGVVHIVGAGPVPTPVDDAEIEAVSMIMRSTAAAGPWPYLRTGDTVKVTHGALSGLTGILLQIKSQYRLVVSVSMLMRSVAVEIDIAWVRPSNSPSVCPPDGARSRAAA